MFSGGRAVSLKGYGCYGDLSVLRVLCVRHRRARIDRGKTLMDLLEVHRVRRAIVARSGIFDGKWERP